MTHPILELPIKAHITKAMVKKLMALEDVEEFTEHYSIYTPGGWSAISLRSFGGSAHEISKPACMNTAWHKKHPGAKEWECKDTPLREAMEEYDPLIEAIPGKKERIRFMRLAAGNKILPHTDKIDKDFVTGRLRRIHVPIVTNDDVMFHTWYGGRKISDQLRVGCFYYLNAGMKHAVDNDGDVDRVHLVMDVISNPNLDKLIYRAQGEK